MRILLCAAVLAMAAGPSFACRSTFITTFPDIKEIAECVQSHEQRIVWQRESFDQWMAIQQKLSEIVYRQQDEIHKLKDEIFLLKSKLTPQQKSRK